MLTECTTPVLPLQGVAEREMIARYDGGSLTAGGGAVLLRKVDRAPNLLGQFAACFTDDRDPTRVDVTCDATRGVAGPAALPSAFAQRPCGRNVMGVGGQARRRIPRDRIVPAFPEAPFRERIEPK